MSAPPESRLPAPSPNWGCRGHVDEYIIEHFQQFRAQFGVQFGVNRSEDILHDAYIRVIAKSSKIKIENPRSYIFKTARNIFIDLIKRAKNESEAFGAESDFASEAIQDNATQFRALMTGLPTSLRDVLILNHLYGYTHREIAERFGISVKAVEKRMQKAMALCAAKLKD